MNRTQILEQFLDEILVHIKKGRRDRALTVLDGLSLWGCWQDVKDFQRQKGFDHPETIVPEPLEEDLLKFRHMLLREESREALEALEQGKLTEIVHECLDVLVVTHGTLVSLGVNPVRPWRVLMHANMAKKPGESRFGKATKPPGWQKPDIAGALGLQAA